LIYVSAQHGKDTNAGTFGEPLREIAKAIELSPAGETVVVVDSGDYKQFTVDKTLAVVAERVHARIRPDVFPQASAVTVGAGSADVVLLRGLTIAGRAGHVGVRFSNGRALHLERCTISGFVANPTGYPSHGIEAEQGILHAKDLVMRDNLVGFDVSGGRVILEGCSIRGDGTADSTGIFIAGTAQGSVVSCLVSDHGSQGIYLRGAPGSARPLLTLTQSTITHNGFGIYADRTGQVHLISSTITLNDSGLYTLNGGVIYTSGTNSSDRQLLAGHP
jgi:hypothetical protein